MKPKIVVILGPTATGKSNLGVKLAKKYKGEIISADSRQVYKGLNIGTGKITKKEMQGIHHWLIDVISPQKTYSVQKWKTDSEERIEKILKRHKLPIIVGGTGFYIESIVKGIVLPEVKPNKKLRAELSKKTTSELFVIIQKLDQERAKNLDKNNKVRLIRAIEIAKALGKVPKVTENKKYEVLQIGLNLDQKELREKTNKRLIKRIKGGMIEEVEKLHKQGLTFKRMEELGLEYRYLALYLQNKISKEEMLEKLKVEIWRYAKRQLTWFKRDKNILWFNPKELSKINSKIKEFLTEK